MLISFHCADNGPELITPAAAAGLFARGGCRARALGWSGKGTGNPQAVGIHATSRRLGVTERIRQGVCASLNKLRQAGA